jgi:hypothetical protein
MNDSNREGYHDPTAHKAISNIRREEKRAMKPRRPLVFICSPFAGDTERNIENARRYSKFAVDKGAIPLAPHLLFPQFLNDGDRAQRDLGLFFGLVLLGKCGAVWAFGSAASEGMKRELAKARERGIPVKFWNEQCEEVHPFA